MGVAANLQLQLHTPEEAFGTMSGCGRVLNVWAVQSNMG